MKSLKLLLIAAFLASAAGNVFLYLRQAGKRTQLEVGATTLNLRDYQNFLNERFGTDMMAKIARLEVVRQEAKKRKVAPKKQEVDQAMDEVIEQRPAIAQEFQFRPYRKLDVRDDIEYTLAMANIRASDVQATEDEIKDYFAANASNYEKPDKLRVKVITCQDAETAGKAKELMERVSDVKVVQRNLDPTGKTVNIAGLDGSMAFSKPFGKPSREKMVNDIAAMKDGAVKSFNTGGGFIVVKREKMEPGARLSLDDEKTRRLATRDYKLTRALPEREVLRKLWDGAKIKTEDPEMMKQMTWLIFRDPKDLGK